MISSFSDHPLPAAFFHRPAPDVAPDLIGAVLLIDGVGGRIVEAEAYDRTDPASHSFGGQTKRNAVMFGQPAHAYVYRSYGLHWCLNFVCSAASAVLIRALEPLAGLDMMAARRSTKDQRLLCSGPGRLCQALGVTLAHNGCALDEPPFLVAQAETPSRIVSGPRIGITRAADTPWRFGLENSLFLSRKIKSA